MDDAVLGGTVSIEGCQDVKAGSRIANLYLREKLSYLFQNFALVDEESVEENLNIALKYAKGSKSEKRNRIKEALSQMGLAGYEKQKIYELSGGEQQRVAIARVLLKPSKILLADEPIGSLDAGNRNTVMKLLRDINKNGKTVVVVTHDMEVAKQCDRIIEINCNH